MERHGFYYKKTTHEPIYDAAVFIWMWLMVSQLKFLFMWHNIQRLLYLHYGCGERGVKGDVYKCYNDRKFSGCVTDVVDILRNFG